MTKEPRTPKSRKPTSLPTDIRVAAAIAIGSGLVVIAANALGLVFVVDAQVDRISALNQVFGTAFAAAIAKLLHQGRGRG